MKSIYFLLLLSFLFCLKLSAQEGLVFLDTDKEDIKSVDIKGDNNVIFYGNQLTINRLEIPEKVVQEIEYKYQQKIISLEKNISENAKEEKLYFDQVQQVKLETKLAVTQAVEIVNTFKNIDFQKSVAKYKEAYTAFQNGKIAFAIQLLDTISFEEEDQKNAENRKLKARFHAVNFEFKEADKNYQIAIRIFENYANLMDYADFLSNQNQSSKKEKIYNKALEIAETNLDSIELFNQLSDHYRTFGQHNKALLSCEQALKCNLLMQLPEEVIADRYSNQYYDYYYEFYASLIRLTGIFFSINEIEGAKTQLQGLIKIFVSILNDYEKVDLEKEEIRAERMENFSKLFTLQLLHLMMTSSVAKEEPEVTKNALILFEHYLNSDLYDTPEDITPSTYWLASYHSTLGNFYANQESPDSAIAAFQKSIELFKELTEVNPERYFEDLIFRYLDLANFYGQQRDLIACFDTYESAEKYAEKYFNQVSYPLKTAEAIFKLNYSLQLNLAGQLEKGLLYSEESLQLFEDLQVKLPEANTLMHILSVASIGESYIKKDSLSIALTYLKKAKYLSKIYVTQNPLKVMNHFHLTFTIYGTIGEVFQKQKLLDSTEYYFTKSIKVFEFVKKEYPEFLTDNTLLKSVRYYTTIGLIALERVRTEKDKAEVYNKYISKAKAIALKYPDYPNIEIILQLIKNDFGEFEK